LQCNVTATPAALTETRRRLVFDPPTRSILDDYIPVTKQVVAYQIDSSSEVSETGSYGVYERDATFVRGGGDSIGSVEIEWTDTKAVRDSSGPQYNAGVLVGIGIIAIFELLKLGLDFLDDLFSRKRRSRIPAANGAAPSEPGGGSSGVVLNCKPGDVVSVHGGHDDQRGTQRAGHPQAGDALNSAMAITGYFLVGQKIIEAGAYVLKRIIQAMRKPT
jgi:hypothetical protein